MYRFTTPIVLCALFVSSFATPLEMDASVPEKRATHTGQGTYYHPGLGACGYTNTDSDLVVAMSVQSFSKSNCGQVVTITDTTNQKTAQGTVVDSCQACAANDLDMSPTLFQKFADLSVGRIPIQWS
ncbi:RlpA-like double-psi beta-barrel-protein domain-containing protein-containing protein [Scleroderma yunnanense]